ncbi:MAG TPA: hypothetical protein VLA19_01665 [Herpetosiphonaceae bacterium]|nr:hypothetical protein [Herpetosiphonaceae bacterium]
MKLGTLYQAATGEQTLTAICREHGIDEATLRAAWEAGRAMPPEQAGRASYGRRRTA